MAIDIADIKRLKDLTGVGLTDAKGALEDAKGDFDKALAAMRKKGLTKAEKRGEREARAGVAIPAMTSASRLPWICPQSLARRASRHPWVPRAYRPETEACRL